jgi:hypothetical protein
MANAIVAFRNFCENALKSYISHTRKIGVLNDMGYEIRSTGVNVVVRVKLQFHGFHSITWDRRTKKHSLTRAKKKLKSNNNGGSIRE